MTRNYKMIAGLVLAGLFLFTGLAGAQPYPGCNAQTIKGTYGILLNVSYPSMPAWGTAAGTMTFDGGAGWSTTAFTNWNGTTTSGTFTGSYTVNRDCTGSVTYRWDPAAPPSTIHFVIVDNGKQVLCMEEGPGPATYVGIRL